MDVLLPLTHTIGTIPSVKSVQNNKFQNSQKSFKIVSHKELEAAKAKRELSFIEVKCSIGARDDLGRPTTTAMENKQNFMEYLRTL